MLSRLLCPSTKWLGLSMSPRRARRAADLPRFASSEAASRRRYPKTIPVPGHDALLRCRASQETWVGGEVDAIARVELFAWLKVDGRRIGAFEFATYDPNGCGDNEDFQFLMDCDDGHEAHLSNVLSSAWADVVLDITHVGPILDFRCAWLAPEFARGRLFADAVNAVTDQLCPDYSILVMRPFLLGASKGSERSKGLTRLHAIMIRHFQRTLGVDRLPGEYWHEGWLWRPNSRCRLIHPPRSGVVLPFVKPADPASKNAPR
jgi:hypothetical protein